MAYAFVLLGIAGFLLVVEKASDNVYVLWAIVLLVLNLLAAEREKAKRRLGKGEDSGSSETGAGHGHANPDQVG